jgi:hypothetical protein
MKTIAALPSLCLISFAIYGVMGMSSISRLSQLNLGIESAPSIFLFEKKEKNYRGLMTKECGIEEGQVFVRIPLENTFYVKEEGDEGEMGQALSWPIQLAYKLVEELKEKRQASKWRTYFASLPTMEDFKADLVHNWDDACTSVFYEDDEGDEELLYDSALICESIRNGKAYREEAAKAYPHLAELMGYSLDVVQTRCCGYSKLDEMKKEVKYHIVAPGFDMMNHSPGVDSFFFEEEVYNDYGNDASRFLSCCHRGKGIEKDSEVFLNYAGKGELSQEACFAYYGFIVDCVGYYQYFLPKREASQYLLESLLHKDTVCVMQVFQAKKMSVSAALIVSEDQINSFSSPLRVAARILASSGSRDELQRMIEEDSDGVCYLDHEHEVRSNLKLQSLLEDKVEQMELALTHRKEDESKGGMVRCAFLRNNIVHLREMLSLLIYV